MLPCSPAEKYSRQARGRLGGWALGRDGPAEALGERDRRAPEALASGLGGVEAAPLDLPGPLWRLHDAAWCAEQRGERLDQLVHRRGDAGADVVGTRRRSIERREDRRHGVGDVQVIPLGRAVAIHGHRLAALPAAGEDRDDATLEVGALPWAVDVGEPQGDRAYPGGGCREPLRLGLVPAVR